MNYAEFIESKHKSIPESGFDWPRGRLPRFLHRWQKDIVLWALRRGRAALFLERGLGKTIQQLAWASAVVKKTGKPVLLLCPLAVGRQTVREAVKFGVKGVALAESQADIGKPGVYVTNYEKLPHFDAEVFGGVVLDESSILKSFSGATKTMLCERFLATPYKLACTATPSPNDHEELGNHAEFLGVGTRLEMLATYFTHDSSDTAKWRLKGHAEPQFWKWVASWAFVLRNPSDLGIECEGYELPPLTIVEHIVPCETPAGQLFAVPASTLTEQRKARRATLTARVALAVKVATSAPGSCIVWCELNDEADEVLESIPGAVQVAGCDSEADKIDRLDGFSEGRYEKIVSKASICGYGMNWQHCNRMVFAGLGHSFEQFHQAIGRVWRFGQTRPVEIHVITSDLEIGVLANVKRKQAAHESMFDSMLKYTLDVNKAAIVEKTQATTIRDYNPGRAARIPKWVKGVAS